MNKPRVYLAGPIAHTTHEESTDWRDLVSSTLNDMGMVGVSPMRGKEYLNNGQIIEPRTGKDKHLLSQPKSIVGRDHYDVSRCDMILLNLLHAKRVSIGTMCELAWAWHLRKPSVVIMEEGNLHDHPFVRELSTFIVSTYPDAIYVVKSVLIDV